MSFKILVVDDSEVARKELVRPLAEKGYDVMEADSGQTGLDVVKEKSPDMVITDVHMPLMNGIEMCEAVKELNLPEPPTILVVSTEASAEIKTRGKAAGVKGWIIKPVDPAKLVAAVGMLAERKK